MPSSSRADSLAVVIPTYNRLHRLKKCLDSVYGQTRVPDEVIVVDDGSTDGSTQSLCDLFPRLKLIRQSNRGVSSARNTGIRAAQSQWIALLDSDDLWLPLKCEKQLRSLQTHPEYRICHCQEKWLYQGREKRVPSRYQKRGGWIFKECLPLCGISPSTVMVDHGLFDEIGYFDESLPVCEDYDLWLRITSRYPVLLVDEPLIEKHGGATDQLSNQRGLDTFRIKALTRILDANQLSIEDRKEALSMLRYKCSIIANGADKGGRALEADRYRSLAAQYNHK